MDVMFDFTYLNGETNDLVPDIPQVNIDVWILGKKYNATRDLERVRRDITSVIWCTYRRGFLPIGDEGLTTDKGWGCMLRCGQMVLANALTKVHLVPDWLWTQETRDPTYLKIIQRFEERKQAPYSIHQIALMGASEGKEVGQWFGPNTVAQVLKKLVAYDKWSGLRIHVALDNTVVIEDIVKECTRPGRGEGLNSNAANKESDWTPLLLMIPLRLGLSDINPVYVNGLKQCFEFPESLGIIGGKPNQALYLIGYIGDEVVYLDPHTTQKAGLVENKQTEEQKVTDLSYHSKFASRILFCAMDPSVAVCFLCSTRDDFEAMCSRVQQNLMKEPQPLFELVHERPPHWGPLEQSNFYDDLDEFERQFDDSDDEFEIL